MLQKEMNYDFKKRLLTIHKSDVVDKTLVPGKDEYVISEGFRIVVPEEASDVIITAAKDFQDYLFTSMKVPAMLCEGGAGENAVILKLDKEQKEDYVITFSSVITVCGKTDRAVMQGLFCLEDKMNVRKAPFIGKEEIKHTFMFSPRMVHPGYGVDEFPTEHLAAIAHAGMDAVLVFTKGPNETPSGFLDYNELIYRAAKYGIDVYAYSYMFCGTHPDDEDAEAVYDSLYGELFRQCPGLKGVTLVGEVVGFKSKDERAYYRDIYDQTLFPSDKPHPGFFPCNDYPKWLECVKKSVYKYKKDADIVFWSYNWGSRPVEDRLSLIENLPTDVALLATYEMYEICDRGNIKEVCSDYTLSFEGPGYYFRTEAEAAKKRGLRLYAMTNTAGQTWDMGVIPYEPMPYQWIKRYYGLRDAKEKWGLSGLMESHHYGFTPSFIGDLAKQAYIQEKPCIENSLRDVIIARFGTKNISLIDEALKKWSEAITYFIPSDDDQYGPFRIGPAYPFCLVKSVKPPANKYAHFGNRILNINYPAGNTMSSTPASGRGMLASLRVCEEIKSLHTMLRLLKDGVEILEKIPEEERNEELCYLVNFGKYLCCYVTTGINAKEWYRVRNRLLSVEDRVEANNIIDEATELLLAEKKNAENAIEFLEKDSRLGWEPSMDYLGGIESVRWKLDYIDFVIDVELRHFRNASDEKWEVSR